LPPQLLYFGGVGAVLAAIWVAQHGPLAKAAAKNAAAGGPGGPKSGDGGGGMVGVPVDNPAAGRSSPTGVVTTPDAAFGSYQYNYNEQASQDAASAYGGVTDSSPQLPEGSVAGLTPIDPTVTTTVSRTGATIAPDVPQGAPIPVFSDVASISAAYSAALPAPTTAEATGPIIRTGGMQ
jgi:hypothetical protein